MLLKVVGNAGQELVLPHPRAELLEHRAALGVGDAIKVHLNVVEVADVGHDGVRRRQLVLAIRPTLLHGRERGPRFVPLGGFGGGERGGILGKRLVEPEVVPPAHGDEVTKPHVCQLVKDCDDATLAHRVGDFAAENICLGERDTTGVFHGARVELGNKELVVLLERIRHAELVFEELKALASFLKDVVGVKVLGEGCAAVNTERNNATARAGEFTAFNNVGACHESGDVRRDARRGSEHPRGRPLGSGCGSGRAHVAHHMPGSGRGHRELEGGFEVGLLKHGKNSPRVGHFELRIQVDLVVDGVDKTVQAFARVRVGEVGINLEHVCFSQAAQRNPHAVGRGQRQVDAVECDAVNFARDGIDECLGSVASRKRKRGSRAERVRPLCDIEIHGVTLHRNVARALLCFDAGQVFSGHVLLLFVGQPSRRSAADATQFVSCIETCSAYPRLASKVGACVFTSPPTTPASSSARRCRRTCGNLATRLLTTDLKNSMPSTTTRPFASTPP